LYILKFEENGDAPRAQTPCEAQDGGVMKEEIPEAARHLRRTTTTQLEDRTATVRLFFLFGK